MAATEDKTATAVAYEIQFVPMPEASAAPEVNYGLLTDRDGRPVSVSAFRGNTGDPKTLLPELKKVREDFRIEQLVLVGDRGMITQKQIDVLSEIEGVDWITALRTEGIRKLAQGGQLQMGLFDERNLFELFRRYGLAQMNSAGRRGARQVGGRWIFRPELAADWNDKLANKVVLLVDGTQKKIRDSLKRLVSDALLDDQVTERRGRWE